MSPDRFDLVVIGGGPAGSTLATLVAKQGRRVLLLEKHRFPRHQIGESLLPSTVHGICRLLGVEQELEQAGFPKKRGGTFLWGRSPVPWTFAFSKAPNSPTGFAYQVERSKFDQLLLENAARNGVDVRQESSVTDLEFDGDRVAGVRYCASNGDSGSARARFVADAAGHQSPFYRRVGQRLCSTFFTNVALYTYFRNGKRLPPPNSGNILCAAFDEGWFWYIPLSAELTSVGVVVSKENVGPIQKNREKAFFGFVDRCPLIKEYLGRASRVTEDPYNEFRVRKDYSYCNTAFHGNGLVLVGDAACFVDPVLSSGVHLATYGALLAARSMNSCFSHGLSEAESFAEFEYRYRREFGHFYEFLASFYDMHSDENSYFWSARKIVKTDESPADAFVRLVAGRAQQDEPAFAEQAVLELPSHDGLGEWFNRHAVAAAAAPGRTSRGVEIEAFDFDSFMPGLSTEMAQIQLQALLGQRRPPDSPLDNQGLIPSTDGLHWMRSQQ